MPRADGAAAAELVGHAGGGLPITLSTATVSVAYTLDLFGRNRRELEAARLMLAGNVVTAAIEEASLRKQNEATDAAVALGARHVRLADLRLPTEWPLSQPSDLARQRPDPRPRNWRRLPTTSRHGGSMPAAQVCSRWSRRNDSSSRPRSRRLETLWPVFLNDVVVVRAADIYAGLKQRGEPIGDADILIGATAAVHVLEDHTQGMHLACRGDV